MITNNIVSKGSLPVDSDDRHVKKTSLKDTNRWLASADSIVVTKRPKQKAKTSKKKGK